MKTLPYARPAAILIFASHTLIAAETDVRPLQANADPAPFTYRDSPEVMPNYLAGEKWSTQGKPITRMQAPLAPEDSAKRMALQPGFRSRLWAAEPDILKPIALAWDERGRLWIAETIDYPNSLKPEGEGRDRIKICEDTDGDGRADRFTVFADKLSVPTSLCFGNGGLIVIESGRTLFLKDTDGDDVADERRTLFEGWNMRDTHATASNLRYGPDNWIWGTVGYSGFEGEVGGQRHRFGQGVYRFKPDGSALEFIKSSNNNTWGLGITEEGLVVGSTANGNASWYMPIPNRFYEAVKGWAANRMESVADSQRIHPITDKVRQVDWHNQYTAGAGHAVYTARSFPEEYWNGVSFVAEPTGHLVGFFKLGSQGADRSAVNMGSFLASDDEWTAPIVAEVGPDGALWVIDWYNYIIQHNPTPIGFQTGKGGAYETALRDKRHGRIYKVSYEGGTPSTMYSLRPDDAEGLVEALQSDNQLWRFHAQRLMVENGKGNGELRDRLEALLSDRSVDELGLNVGVQHALWTLKGLGAIEAYPSVRKAAQRNLAHPSAGARMAAIAGLPRDAATVAALATAGSLTDSDAQVRLAAYLALAESPAGPQAAQLVYESLKENLNTEDRWLRDASASAAAHNADGFLMALLEESAALPDGAAAVVSIVGRHYASSAPSSILQTLAVAARAHPRTSAALLAGIVDGWPKGSIPSLNAKEKANLAGAIRRLSPEGQDSLLVLARMWNQLELFPDALRASVNRLMAEVSDERAQESDRSSAARKLIELADEPETIAAVLEQVNLQASPALASGLMRALRSSQRKEGAALILENWPRFSPGQKSVAMDALLSRGDWIAQVFDAIDSGQVPGADIGSRRWSGLLNNPNEALARRARELSERLSKGSADREAVLKAFLPAVQMDGDLERGQALFASACLVCHMFYGEGGKVGPDLSGIGVRPKEEILTAILDPNRSVEANYQLWTVATQSGGALSGRLDSETQTSIDLYDLGGQRHSIQRSDIAGMTRSEVSIMPAGFESLGEQGLADILDYLASAIHH